MSRTRRVLAVASAVALLAVSSVWCFTAARVLGATFDEPFYVQGGLEFWRNGRHGLLLRKGTMPLPPDVATLPLHVVSRWTGQPVDPVTDLPEALPWARTMTLVWWAALLASAAAIARSVAGVRGALLALALLSTQPTLLAHASLATTDVAVTASLLVLALAYRAGREAVTVRRIGLPALAFAVALLAKASALVLGPLVLLGVELARRGRALDVRSFVRETAAISGLGLLGATVYCGSDWMPDRSFLSWAQGLGDPRARAPMTWIAETLAVFPNSAQALARQIQHNVRGHGGAFLLGDVVPRAVWYYFPVALALKVTLAVLLLLPVVLLRLRAVGARAFGENWPLAVAALLLVSSLTHRVQIGIRIALPLLVFLIVAVAAAVALETRRRPAVALLAVLAVAGSAVEAARAWPDGLRYANALCGGSDGAYRCLSDSNYDWGQGLPELDRWRTERGVDMAVWYFGTDPRLARLPIELLPLHALPPEQAADPAARAEGKYLAVGLTLLHGVPVSPAAAMAAEVLRRHRPVARTGTFFIYDFTGERRLRRDAATPRTDGAAMKPKSRAAAAEGQTSVAAASASDRRPPRAKTMR